MSPHFFLKINKDLKLIHIYFENDYPIAFNYKKKVYKLEPYEKSKIYFKNPSDLLNFIKQNIKTIKLLNNVYKNTPSIINYYDNDYLDLYKYKKSSIQDDSFEYPKILNGYYVKNIEDVEIESKFDLSVYRNHYLDLFEKKLNSIHTFVLYLRYIDMYNEHIDLLEYYEDIIDVIEFIESRGEIFDSDDNTNTLYKKLYNTHINPLLEKLKEKLIKLNF
jgi:hypothetical protein